MKNKILPLAMKVMALCLLGMVLLTQGCVNVASGRQGVLYSEDVFQRNYPAIKQMVIEEAANNGFSTLSAEIKPLPSNNWKGRLFFQLTTALGTDQLFVNFKKLPNGVGVFVSGAGTRGDAAGASKAIQERLLKTELK